MNSISICFLIGSAHISGGTYVVLQHALWLQAKGWEVTIVPLHPWEDAMLSWHKEAQRRLKFSTLEQARHRRFDVALATWWKTALTLHELDARQYMYFVQSIETRFFPSNAHADRALVDATYGFGLPVITEASWIQRYFAERSVSAQLAKNGIRKDIYRPVGPAVAPRQPGILRVLVEGTLHVPYKNVERTMQLCRMSKAQELWLMTSTPEVHRYPGADQVFCCVGLEEAAAVYRSCDVLVKLSYVEGMFGPPLEQFHCGGTAIVYDVTGADEYMIDGNNSVVLKRDDEEGVIRALNRLHDFPAMLEGFKSHAQATAAAWPDWDSASKQFGEAIEKVMAQSSGPSRERLRLSSESALQSYELAKSSVSSRGHAPSRLRQLYSRAKDKFYLGAELLRQRLEQ